MRAPASWLLMLGMLCAGCNNNPWPSEVAGQDAILDTFSAITTLDPSVCYNADGSSIVDLIYPSFYRYRYSAWKTMGLELALGSKDPVVFDGPIDYHDATGVHRVQGEKWTFEIRHDILFQDDPCFPGGKGRRATTKDIIFAFKRMANPKTLSPVADFLSDKVLGWKQFAAGFSSGYAHYDEPMTGIRPDPTNPYRFEVLLNQPYPQLRFVMGMHFTTPLAQEAVERYGDDFAVRHPVGCGPYQVQELKIRDRLILTKNPNCHWALYPTGHEPGDDPKLLQIGPKPLPLTLKLEFIGIQEPLTSYNLFRQGYIDSISAGYSNAQIIRGATGLTPEMKADGMSLVQALWCGYFYLGFNMMDATFGGYTQSKRKLREAISLSIDTDAYIQVVCQGLGKPANFCLPPGLFGYDPNYRNPYRQFDPSLKEAKRLLTEAGFPNGIDPSTGRKLVLHFDNYSTTPTLRQMVRLFQIQIERLGIRVELRDTTYDVYKARLNKHQTQFYFGSWIADYPDPENFLTTMYGPNAAPGPNETNYSNKTYDALFERMRAMRDTPERLALVHKLRDIAVPDCPLIPLSFGESRDIFPPWISNAQPHPIANDALLYWKVNPALRAKDQAEWNRPRVWPVAILGIAIIALALPGTTAILHRRRRKVRRG